MLFHPMENQYTLPQLQSEADRLGLEVVGINYDNVMQYWVPKFLKWVGETYTQQEEHQTHPLADLAKWHGFEQTQPLTFRTMYKFVFLKPDEDEELVFFQD